MSAPHSPLRRAAIALSFLTACASPDAHDAPAPDAVAIPGEQMVPTQPGATAPPGSVGAATPTPPSGTPAPATCEPGTLTTAWATGCKSGQATACTPGAFAITNPPNMPAVRAQSEHFALRWNGSVVSDALAKEALASFEAIWTELVDRIGFPAPYCDSATKYKVNVHIDPSHGLTGGGTGARDPGMWIGPGALRDPWGMAHEFTHGLQFATRGLRDSPYVGWVWESHANWMAHQVGQNRQNPHCAELLVNYPHVYFGSTRNRYCNFQFWEFLKDKYCPQAVNDLWRSAPKQGAAGHRDADPFTVLAATRNWSPSQLNDFVGEWAMHNVAWDYKNPDGSDQGALYRRVWGYTPEQLASGGGLHRLRLTRLEPVANTAGVYKVPSAWAPQRWGYNLVKLAPAAGATSLTVRFSGSQQKAPANTRFAPYADAPTPPNPDADYRWGLVAVGASGAPRYSSLQRGAQGSLCFAIAPGDTAVYLVVAATPSAIHKVLWDQKYFSLYRYPWSVRVDGATPVGSDAPSPVAGARKHPNGGGWVAPGASVAATAYVGPYAMVLGGTVSGRARIEDHAIVVSGTVTDDAVVSALSIVTGGLRVDGSAKVATVFQGPGSFGRGQRVGGTAQLIGDVELQGENLALTKGVFYGFVDPQQSTQAQHGAQQTAPMGEVTASPAP
ncbi:MAG: Svx/AvrXca family virulence/avirulence protein [Polyangiales bacterium]